MRRFSQRNSLVTLNEINITPLLDLAFVLLIIFVITRPLLEQNINLQLPKDMGSPDTKTIDRKRIKLVEITASGAYFLGGRSMSTLKILEQELWAARKKDTNIIVQIRADKNTPFNNPMGVIDACQRIGITQYSISTAPSEHR